MQQLEIKYRPVSFLNFTLSKTGSFPEDMGDLSPVQFIEISKLKSAAIDETLFLSVMTGFNPRFIKKLSEFHRFKLMQLFGFFNNSAMHHDFIIKKINFHKAEYFAPKPKLKGVTFEQFIFADSYFSDYSNNKTPADLHKFVASLYLPQFTGFSESQIETNATLIKKVDAATLEAICLNYSFVKGWLAKSYPLVFQSGTDDNQPTGSAPPGNNSWIKTFEAVVGDDIVNSDKYASIPIHNILRFLSDRIKQNMKRK